MSLRELIICPQCMSSNNIQPICKKCNSIVVDYAEETIECVSCHYGKDFVPDTNYKTGVCSQCMRMTHLDSNMICLSCHIINAAAESQNNDWGNIKRCSCGEIIHKKQRTCPACSSKSITNLRKDKVCYGCQTYFKPVSVYDTFCIPCKEGIQRGVCTCCKELVNDMDSRGWCSKCQASNG